MTPASTCGVEPLYTGCMSPSLTPMYHHCVYYVLQIRRTSSSQQVSLFGRSEMLHPHVKIQCLYRL
jgi:hypothetical protein